jgi:hypothetical protein
VELILVQLRSRAVIDVRDGMSVTNVGRRNRVSRRTLPPWLRRSDEGGLADLTERNSAPESCPHQMAPLVGLARPGAETLQVGPTVDQTMSIEWLTSIDQGSVSEVQLADGWHTIDVPSFIVSPQDASFSFDETVSHTHTSPRTRVVVGPLSAVLAVAFAN